MLCCADYVLLCVEGQQTESVSDSADASECQVLAFYIHSYYCIWTGFQYLTQGLPIGLSERGLPVANNTIVVDIIVNNVFFTIHTQ